MVTLRSRIFIKDSSTWGSDKDSSLVFVSEQQLHNICSIFSFAVLRIQCEESVNGITLSTRLTLSGWI